MANISPRDALLAVGLKACSVEDCGREPRARGMCSRHYKIQWRSGHFEVRVCRTSAEVLQRDQLGRKYCIRCGEWKPVSAFHANVGKIDGLYSHCGACTAPRHRRWYDDLTPYQRALLIQGTTTNRHIRERKELERELFED